MGQLTRDTIISEGLQLMGRPDLTPRAQVWLNTLLGSLYAKYDWPFLTQRSGLIALGAGVSVLTVGDGLLITDKIQYLKKAFLGDTVNNGSKGEITLVHQGEVAPESDPLWADTTVRGDPRMLVVEPVSTNPFQWTLKGYPIPAKNHRIILQYKKVPSYLTGNTTPLYPNDETLIQGIFVAALKHQQDERFAVENGTLQQMIREDRVTFGKVGGSAPKVGLSKAFGRRVRNDTGWMGD